MIQPGELRYKTTLNVNDPSQQTDFGDFSNGTTTSHTKFCRMKWLPGSERIDNEVLNLIKNAEFTFRYSAITELIDRLDTITFENDIFYIKSIQYKGQGNQQVVMIKGHTAVN